jgi:hypothetical protein
MNLKRRNTIWWYQQPCRTASDLTLGIRMRCATRANLRWTYDGMSLQWLASFLTTWLTRHPEHRSIIGGELEHRHDNFGGSIECRLKDRREDK